MNNTIYCVVWFSFYFMVKYNIFNVIILLYVVVYTFRRFQTEKKVEWHNHYFGIKDKLFSLCGVSLICYMNEHVVYIYSASRIY